MQYIKSSIEQNCVDWMERLKKHLQLPCACGSVLLWRRHDMLCNSSFMDDVMFVHNGQE